MIHKQPVYKIQFWIECVNCHQREEKRGSLSPKQLHLRCFLPLIWRSKDSFIDLGKPEKNHQELRSSVWTPCTDHPRKQVVFKSFRYSPSGMRVIWTQPHYVLYLRHELLSVCCDLTYLNSFLWINRISGLSIHQCRTQLKWALLNCNNHLYTSAVSSVTKHGASIGFWHWHRD